MRALALAAALVGCGGSTSGSSDSSALPAIVAQHTIEQLTQAQKQTAMLDCQQIVMGAELFYAENGRHPASVDALVESKVLPRPMKDPWESAYDLRVEGDALRVRSAGPDRKLDTDDDLRCDR
jgi:type II secretion system (T2SS) protein G